MVLSQLHLRLIFTSSVMMVLVFFFYSWKSDNASVLNFNAVFYSLITVNNRYEPNLVSNITSHQESNGSVVNTDVEAVLDVLEQNNFSLGTDFDFEEATPLIANFHLWSQQPNMVNWSETAQMCSSIMHPVPTDAQGYEEYKSILDNARTWTVPFVHTDQSVLSLMSDCARFRQTTRFQTKPASRAEARFPLAYVFLGARNAAQTIRHFLSIYQPQNAYCLTYDNKSEAAYQETIRQLVTCFSDYKNVFISPHPEPVYYGLYSVLHSVMECLKVLLNNWKAIPWRYVQIVSWNDFPLRTNAEMVEIFQILNGSQDSALDPLMTEFFVPTYDINSSEVPRRRAIPPDGLTMYKGSFATSMTKDFVQFLFTNPTSIRFYEWLNNSMCAEEHYWVSIIHNLQLNAPGSFPGQCSHFYQHRGVWKPFASRYQVWDRDWWYPANCKGKYYKLSCVYGVGDLPVLVERPEFVAHKLYEEFEPAALFCLEQWYWNRTNTISSTFNESYYESFPSVRYQNSKDKNEFIC